MFGRNRKRAAAQVDAVRAAKREVQRAQAVLDRVLAQQPEVDERVGRLALRERRNNFGEALTEAMERRKPA